MSRRDLLIEIGTEELPPKALDALSDAFAEGIASGLQEANVEFDEYIAYASPRRLAVLLKNVNESQPDSEVEKRGPAIKSAFDDAGNPSKAAEGFARGCGVAVSDLETMKTDKGEWLLFRMQEKGKPTTALVPEIVSQSLAKLPIPKRMRWGDSSEEFVRPVHWVVLLFGDDVIEATILGIAAGRESRGHRFHHPQGINLQNPNDYIDRLDNPGRVIVDRDVRRQAILQQAEQAAEKLGGRALINDDLLQEVSALVEWPIAIAGDFDEHFLEVPAESLISSMQDHQKYFPVTDAEGNLLPHFITISNIDSKDPDRVKEGNERVIRPRLADAAFFWQQDCRHPLETRMAALDKVVFQNKLGSVGDKSRRVAKIAEKIAEQLGADKQHAHRAALLSKCDLMSEMVGEFADLQGIMGRYYAEKDGEAEDVAIALDEQYMPRFAGDELPTTMTGQILAVADKIDTLLGIFAIGQKPSGVKDPFALRRAAIGVLRILIERDLMLDLREILGFAADALEDVIDARDVVEDVVDFMLERLRVYYTSQDIPLDVYDAVAVLKPTRPVDFDRRVLAVNSFRSLDAAESLAAANKRIRNILKKIDGECPQTVDVNLFQEDAEKTLHEKVEAFATLVIPMFAQGDYKSALEELSALREPVDNFFDKVMVMSDDQTLKNNRVALLAKLYGLFLEAADLSRLQS
ncbi:MAG: glycine--tRNA ligase subunit beta [Gammaproteobacteria bacterium]|nr:glycine--tRNA ligase subunit beta [Gammaproteobacteria bacterium]